MRTRSGLCSNKIPTLIVTVLTLTNCACLFSRRDLYEPLESPWLQVCLAKSLLFSNSVMQLTTLFVNNNMCVLTYDESLLGSLASRLSSSSPLDPRSIPSSLLEDLKSSNNFLFLSSSSLFFLFNSC